MSFIREELKHLKTEPRDLRKFGLLVGGVLVLLGLWFVFRHKPWHPWLWVPGAGLMAFALIAPRGLKQIHLGWMILAITLGLVVSTILLTLFFYVVVTSIGMLARLFGKDFLARKWSNSPSYWLVRPTSEAKQPRDYERQF